MKIWDCKIGEVDEANLPHGADWPMRQAVRDAYVKITGQEPVFLFSGWGATLTDGERAVVENRAPAPMTGAECIAAERKRQIEVEGFTTERDQLYAPGALTMAAICYATMAGSDGDMRHLLRVHVPEGGAWPWFAEAWKPGKDDTNASRIRELEKAGALIAAEIDRLLAKG